MTQMSPFVKWAGGKRQLIKEIMTRLPDKYNTYFEPFVGGGALFFHLAPSKSVINDITKELIITYEVIRDNVDDLIDNLNKHMENHVLNPSEYYYSVRKQDREIDWSNADKLTVASRMIYLNKACFNGLYRVNRAGYFNVPFNKKDSIITHSNENLMLINNFLNSSRTTILNTDFEDVVKNAIKGDFVFFDPPYDVIKKETFDSYNPQSFGVEGQKRLARVFQELTNRGVYVMLTNHNTPLINDLYSNYHIDVIEVKRMINSDSKNRRGTEVIVYNYEVE